MSDPYYISDNDEILLLYRGYVGLMTSLRPYHQNCHLYKFYICVCVPVHARGVLSCVVF